MAAGGRATRAGEGRRRAVGMLLVCLVAGGVGAPGVRAQVSAGGSLEGLAPGDYPEWLEVQRGFMGAADVDGKRWLAVRGHTDVDLLLGDTLQAPFTLEFTAQHPNGRLSPMQVLLVQSRDRHGYAVTTRRQRHATAVFGPFRTGIDAGGRQSFGQLPDSLATQFVRYRLEVGTPLTRVFVNDSLVAQLRGVDFGRSDRLRFYIPVDTRVTAYIGDIEVRGGAGSGQGNRGGMATSKPEPPPSQPPGAASPPAAATAPSSGASVPPIGEGLVAPERTPVQPGGGAPTQVAATALGPTSARLTWSAPSGASGYVVFRAPSAQGPWTSLTVAPVSGTAFTDTALAPGLEAHYTVEAQYNGTGGGLSTPVSVQTPLVHAAGFAATQPSPGVVELTWQAAPGSPRYWIATGGAGSGYAQGTQHTLTGVAPGTHTYTLVAEYDVPGFGAYQPDVTSAPKATVTVAGTSGRYRVTVNGFKATIAIPDGLPTDGKGNEVYVATHVSYWENGAWQQKGIVRSAVYGDVNGFPARVKAGTESSDGGIRNGDQYPGVPWLRTAPPQVDHFPYLAWEGELRQGGNAVLLTPTLWEWSGGEQDYYGHWAAAQDTQLVKARSEGTEQAWYDRLLAVGTLEAVAGRSFNSTSAVNAFANYSKILPESPSGWSPLVDRPIGGHVGDGRKRFIPLDVVLTYELVEAALAASPSTIGSTPPGILAIEYSASRMDEHAYTIYLQVERVP